MDESKFVKSIMPSEDEEKPTEALERRKNEFLEDVRDASLKEIGIPGEGASEEEEAELAARREELTGDAKMKELRNRISGTADIGGEEEEFEEEGEEFL
jgi:hypothetical protein